MTETPPVVPCIDCGVDVDYRGDELLRWAPQIRRALCGPSARCRPCYDRWQDGLSAEDRVALRTFHLAVTQYLSRENRMPPGEVVAMLDRSGFGDQWRSIAAAWRQRAAERRAGHSEDVE